MPPEYPGNQGSGDWEPQGPDAWLELDPLSRHAARDNSDELYNLARVTLGAYQRLPPPLRRQSWREREAFASLWDYRPNLRQELSQNSWLGVGRRSVDGRRTLAAIISTEMPLPPDPLDAHEAYGIPRELDVPSRLPGIGQGSIPVVVERTAAPMLYGEVTPGNWGLASSSEAVRDVAPLQSGDSIAGENYLGARSPGTLAAIVSRIQDNRPLLLSAAHVLGPPGQKVVAYRGGPRLVGEVIDSDAALDAAIAQPWEPWHFDFRLRAGDMLPALPIPPTSDMPVRMWGAVSAYQEGWIDQALRMPAGAGKISMLIPFSARLPSAPGDSGALIVAGPGSTSGFPAAPAAGAADPLTGSILGMLLAGPNQRMSYATPEVWAVPVIEVVERFGLQVWVHP